MRTTRRHLRSGLTLGAVVFAIGGLSATAAGAAEIGSESLDTAATATQPCSDVGASCLQTQDKIGGDETVNLVPADGRILTRFRFRQVTDDVALVILRLSGGAFSQIGGTIDVQGSGLNEIQSFTTHIVVQPGDFIGLKLGPGASIGVIDGPPNTNAWELSDANPPVFIDDTQPSELLLDARVERDRDADGKGDETEDPDGGFPPAPAGPAAPTKPALITPPAPDPLAALRAGKRPGGSIAGKAVKASKKGVVGLTIVNPNGYTLTGKFSLKAARLKLGSRTFSVGAKDRKVVRVKLSRKAFRALVRRRRMSAVATAKFRGPIGKSRTVTRKLSITAPKKAKRKRKKRPPAPGGGGSGIDGTYEGTSGPINALRMVIKNGEIVTVVGSVFTYCTKSSTTRTYAYAFPGTISIGLGGNFKGESGDDGDSSTERFEGQVSPAGTASGYASFFDYRFFVSPYGGYGSDTCFVGGKWTAKKR